MGMGTMEITQRGLSGEKQVLYLGFAAGSI